MKRPRAKDQKNAQTSSGPHRRPLLARALNALGVATTATVESILGWVQALALAGLAAAFIILFVVMRVNVPTGSMKPTIPEGASFFVDKISYYFREPTPGQFIVFWHTNQWRQGNQLVTRRDRLVKRLIAVSGQRVQLRDCWAYVNGQPLTSDLFNHPKHPVDGRDCYRAAGRMRDQEWTVPTSGPGGRCVLAGEEFDNLKSEPILPAECYFVLGDNSVNSEDSRYWGFVSRREFIGVPFLQVWPPEQLGFVNGYFGSAR